MQPLPLRRREGGGRGKGPFTANLIHSLSTALSFSAPADDEGAVGGEEGGNTPPSPFHTHSPQFRLKNLSDAVGVWQWAEEGGREREKWAPINRTLTHTSVEAKEKGGGRGAQTDL